jgi:chemotaxis protein methyltransferase CheR
MSIPESLYGLEEIDEMLNRLHSILGHHSVDISILTPDFVVSCLSERFLLTGTNANTYFTYCIEHPEEQNELLQSLTNSYSCFFRNPLSFALLEQLILPLFFDSKGNQEKREIRIWSAGCAAGQEAYSVAILIYTLLKDELQHTKVRIFATDISHLALDKAHAAIFDSHSVQKIRKEFLDEYFHKSGNSYKLNSEISRMVDFSYFNLLDPDAYSPSVSIFGGFDLIFCSNVLIYYKPEIQEQILNKIHKSMNKGALLICDDSEKQIVAKSSGFTPFFPLSAIFSKV